jgi:hypothetical protein
VGSDPGQWRQRLAALAALSASRAKGAIASGPTIADNRFVETVLNPESSA